MLATSRPVIPPRRRRSSIISPNPLQCLTPSHFAPRIHSSPMNSVLEDQTPALPDVTGVSDVSEQWRLSSININEPGPSGHQLSETTHSSRSSFGSTTVFEGTMLAAPVVTGATVAPEQRLFSPIILNELRRSGHRPRSESKIERRLKRSPQSRLRSGVGRKLKLSRRRRLMLSGTIRTRNRIYSAATKRKRSSNFCETFIALNCNSSKIASVFCFSDDENSSDRSRAYRMKIQHKKHPVSLENFLKNETMTRPNRDAFPFQGLPKNFPLYLSQTSEHQSSCLIPLLLENPSTAYKVVTSEGIPRLVRNSTLRSPKRGNSSRPVQPNSEKFWAIKFLS